MANQRFQRYWTWLKIQAQRNQNQKTSYQNLPSITLRQSATVHLALGDTATACQNTCSCRAAPQWGTWIYRALTFLVISCPCALVISIPLSFFAGIGGASNARVFLIKGSNYLETLSTDQSTLYLTRPVRMTRGRISR